MHYTKQPTKTHEKKRNLGGKEAINTFLYSRKKSKKRPASQKPTIRNARHKRKDTSKGLLALSRHRGREAGETNSRRVATASARYTKKTGPRQFQKKKRAKKSQSTKSSQSSG